MRSAYGDAMPHLAPYLQRRGDALFFRIAVPADLRPHIGEREITKTLRTVQKTHAIPMALEYAALVKRVFIEVRAGMAEQNEQKLREILLSAKHKLRLDELRDQHQEELDERDRQYKRELEQVRLKSENEVMRRVLVEFKTLPIPTPSPISESALAPLAGSSVPMLSAVIDGFMTNWPKDKKEMLKKHRTVLPMFLEIVGDKSVTSLRQADLNEFFRLIQELPPRWKDMCGRRKMTVCQLAATKHPKVMGPGTFDDIRSVRFCFGA